MAKGRINDFYTQYKELLEKFDSQESLLKENNKLIKNLNSTIENLTKSCRNLFNYKKLYINLQKE